MNTLRPKITVLLPTFNDAARIRPTLESVKWADEILVVDSFSSDDTLAICREYGARIIQREYINSATQKNWAAPQCTHEWILQMDTDEVLEDGTREEILDAIAHATSDVHAFRLPRKNHILGQWLTVENLYPDYQTRLFRREVGRWEDKEVHAHVIVPGRVGALTHHILHQGMVNISQQLRNMDRYTRYQADEMNKRGKKFHWYHLALRPIAVFAYYFLWKRGYSAGYRGLCAAAISTSFDFFAHAKLWELQTLKLPASPK